MASVKLVREDSKGPFRKWAAKFDSYGRDLPRGKQLSSREMTTATPGRRNSVPTGTDQNAPRQQC